MMATHCLRIQSCNCLAICRALTRSSRNQVHTETSVRFHCLTPPHLLFQPHLAPSDSHTYHIKTSPPTKPATAALCFQREAILLLKNPLLEELSHAFLYCFPENFYYFLQNCVYSAVTRYYTVVNRPSSEDEPVSDATVFLTKENSETTLFSLFTASINDVTTILNKTLKYMFNKY